jgi:hypothetical protein
MKRRFQHRYAAMAARLDAQVRRRRPKAGVGVPIRSVVVDKGDAVDPNAGSLAADGVRRPFSCSASDSEDCGATIGRGAGLLLLA